jgi:hypothetical protein
VQDDLDVERLRSSVRIRISDSHIHGMCVGILYFYFHSPLNRQDALLGLPIPSAKIVWRQDGMHTVCTGRKERERESARVGGKEEERKPSAEAIGGASAAAAAILKEISVDLFKEQHRSRSWCSPAPLPICTPCNYICPSFTVNAAR